MTRFLRRPTHSSGSSDRKHALYSSSHYRPPVLLALLDLFTLPQDITYAGADDIDALDPEEAGFQSSFSKLGASEKSVHDPVGDVSDSKVFASKQIASRSAQKPGVVSTVSGSLSLETHIQIGPLVQEAQKAEPGVVGNFVQYMGTNGDNIV